MKLRIGDQRAYDSSVPAGRLLGGYLLIGLTFRPLLVFRSLKTSRSVSLRLPDQLFINASISYLASGTRLEKSECWKRAHAMFSCLSVAIALPFAVSEQVAKESDNEDAI